MIEIEQLSKTWRETVVLNNLDLQVKAGQCLLVAGRNGSGRTTLLRILATLDRPDSGSVSVFGIDLLKKAADVRRITGYIPEKLTPQSSLRVSEFLEFESWARCINSSAVGDVVQRSLLPTDLTGTEIMKDLSAGLFQQVAWAVASLGSPRVLLLDEPFSHLDPIAQSRFQLLLRKEKERGTTIVIASNRLDGLQSMLDRVVTLDSGVVRDVDVKVSGQELHRILEGSARVCQR